MKAVFICDAVRTPIGRYGGALALVRSDDLAAVPLRELVRRGPNMDWSAVDEVMLGCANQAGEDNRNVARMALLLAGIPESVAGTTINRLCGSGMDAVGTAARAIARTAGNASGINDGAAALIIASEAAVARHGLNPCARVLGMATAGVAPRVMGLGPVPATQKLMARTKKKISDFDWIQLNEAFASQSLACLRQLGLPDDAEHVNATGGAMALGHPLGMICARLVLTASHQLQKFGGKLALATMCIGVGQGSRWRSSRFKERL